MSNNKMLIDATHPEETRVVVLRSNRVEEFDYESAARKLLRGNIYLAKVTRVEPSLQAAFVEYGGNRHGFLAFNEIHPDYYQIPMADRQALLEQEAEEEAREEAEADARAERLARRRGFQSRPSGSPGVDEPQPEIIETIGADEDGDRDGDNESSAQRERAEAVASVDETISEPLPPETIGGFEPVPEPEEAGQESTTWGASDEGANETQDEQEDRGSGTDSAAGATSGSSSESEPVEQTGSEDALEELPSRPRRYRRSYKIQEVIKRRQVILVQVVKEERGNKGAALTTYLSLAGRYTVLMPNTARGGGISRKITNPIDRKRLKAIATELEVPEGMGLIIRTAGAARTKQEIKRDFEYLLRLWESVRDLTLSSTAPSLVYEEGNLIKRSIRDLYNKDVEEIVVAGEHAHKDAKDFMRMLMPSHAKHVILHQEQEPLFTRYGIERQLNAMFSPYVTLRSGGYLVINQTEALVAIDVNSGKATREFSIEETALNTNLEAAEEIARQLKLRDLAGLIVIDFIDMEEKRNNRAVERQLKEALRFDRARIQLGRISHFGLMEMSRQRMRTGVLEGSTTQCPHCQGTGIIRSTESVALAVLRGLEDTLLAGAKTSLIATTTSTVALYILNNKRSFIIDMEARNGISIAVQASDKLQGANFTIDKGHAPAQPVRRPERSAVNMDWGFEGEGQIENETGIASEPDEDTRSEQPETRDFEPRQPEGEDASGDGRGRRRRRRGRRDGRDNVSGERSDRANNEGRHGNGARHERASRAEFVDSGDDPAGEADNSSDAEAGDSQSGFEQPRVSGDAQARRGEGESQQPRSDDGRGGRRRRRGRRGGRRGGQDRNRHEAGNGEGAASHHDSGADDGSPATPAMENSTWSAAPSETNSRPPRERHNRPGRPFEPTPPAQAQQPQEAPRRVAPTQPAEGAATRPRVRSNNSSSEPKIERVVVGPGQMAQPDIAEAQAPAAAAQTRKGWWQRKLSGE